MKIPIFNSQIEVKDYGCQRGHSIAMPVPKSVNIFVKVTDACNANCRFCSNALFRKQKRTFDHVKLWKMVDELQANNVIINRINVTGGEPALASDTVNKILERVYDYPSIHLHLNTNGLLSDSQKLMRHTRWDSISISLHHYDLRTLSEIYGCAIPEDALKFKDIDLSIVNASCNLIKNYIDSAQKVEKMMQSVLDMGIPRLGFVALMKVNQYSTDNFVDYSDIDFSEISNFYFTESRKRGKDCKCSNYLYNHGGKILEIYMRNYCNPHYCESALLYDGEYFRQGFNNENIIF